MSRPEPSPEDLLEQGREAICTALGELEKTATNPKLAGLLHDLQDEVASSHDGSDLRGPRANYVFRRTDDYYRRAWDEVSANPRPNYEEHVSAIGAMYWARRVSYEWRWPGKWSRTLSV